MLPMSISWHSDDWCPTHGQQPTRSGTRADSHRHVVTRRCTASPPVVSWRRQNSGRRILQDFDGRVRESKLTDDSKLYLADDSDSVSTEQRAGTLDQLAMTQLQLPVMHCIHYFFVWYCIACRHMDGYTVSRT